jgi:mono/diheme cytochrome c family protein
MLALVAVLAGCSAHSPSSKSTPPARATSTPPGIVNGERIFQTGRDTDGKQITAASRPLRSSCAACHGPNGAGGIKVADDAVSADLRHRVLAKEKPAWTQQRLERAISQGIDNEGERLNPVMPRWRMSARDLHDVAEYVLTELK